MTEVFGCADCHAMGQDVEMIDDNDAGHLCPLHDAHTIERCFAPSDEGGFPCSGEDGEPCVLNAADWLSGLPATAEIEE